jgi:hypothetical protein
MMMPIEVEVRLILSDDTKEQIRSIVREEVDPVLRGPFEVRIDGAHDELRAALMASGKDFRITTRHPAPTLTTSSTKESRKMDRAILEGQLAALESQLAALPPGSPESVTVQAQITVLQNELAEQPIVPPIFGPHPWHGPHGR